MKYLMILPLLCCCVALTAAENLMANGDFQAAPGKNGNAPHWGRKPVEHQDPPYVRLGGVGGESRRTAPARVVPVHKVDAVELQFRYRCSGVSAAGIELVFLDEAGTEMPADGFAPSMQGTRDWTAVKQRFFVPKGATQLRLQPWLRAEADGHLDFNAMELKKLSWADVPPDRRYAGYNAIDAGEAAPAAISAVAGGWQRDGAAVQLSALQLPLLADDDAGLPTLACALQGWKADAAVLPLDASQWQRVGYRKRVAELHTAAATRGGYLLLDVGAAHARWPAIAEELGSQALVAVVRPEADDVDGWMQAATAAAQSVAEGPLLVAADAALAVQLDAAAVGKLAPGRLGVLVAVDVPDEVTQVQARQLPGLLIDCHPVSGSAQPYVDNPDLLGRVKRGGSSWLAGSMAAEGDDALVEDHLDFKATPAWGAFVRGMLYGATYQVD